MSRTIAHPFRLITIIFFLLQNVLSRRLVKDCPAFCFCDVWLELRRASCTNIHLYSIYTGVSGDVQALDLYNNSVSSLDDKVLWRAGLTQLKYLNLSLNIIAVIEQNAFLNLDKLAVLDLSRNHLDYIAPDTFLYNIELKVLRLNLNKFSMNVPQLRSPSIIELGLQDCKIHHIPTDTFKDMKNLQYVDISYNFMFQVDSHVFVELPHLKVIYLQGNNWLCNNMMKQLMDYLRKKGVKFKPVCEIPSSKKLEKMVMEDTSTTVDKMYESYSSEEKDDASDVWNIEESPLEILQNITESTKESPLARMKDLSPYWLLAIGFLLGSAVTIVVTYVLLPTTLSCFRPMNRQRCFRDTVADASQRVSLLQNLWQSTSGEINDTASQRPACPGTPPPPYREVMLHRNLYPSPSVTMTRSSAASTDYSSDCT